MNKAFLPVVLTILTGCAAQTPEQTASNTNFTSAVGADGQLLAAAADPSAQLDVADFTSTTVCKKVVSTGSRLIRGQRCSAPDNLTWREKDYMEKRLEWELDDINRRREQDIRWYQQQEMQFMRPQPIPR